MYPLGRTDWDKATDLTFRHFCQFLPYRPFCNKTSSNCPIYPHNSSEYSNDTSFALADLIVEHQEGWKALNLSHF